MIFISILILILILIIVSKTHKPKNFETKHYIHYVDNLPKRGSSRAIYIAKNKSWIFKENDWQETSEVDRKFLSDEKKE